MLIILHPISNHRDRNYTPTLWEGFVLELLRKAWGGLGLSSLIRGLMGALVSYRGAQAPPNLYFKPCTGILVAILLLPMCFMSEKETMNRVHICIFFLHIPPFFLGEREENRQKAKPPLAPQSVWPWKWKQKPLQLSACTKEMASNSTFTQWTREKWGHPKPISTSRKRGHPKTAELFVIREEYLFPYARGSWDTKSIANTAPVGDE